MLKKITLLLTAVLLAACSIEVSDAPPTTVPATPTSQPSILPTPVSPILPSPSPAADVPWADLGLSGRLYFLTFTRGAQQLVMLDLASGLMSTVLEPDGRAWLTAADLSPDAKQLVLAYAPPPEENQIQFGYTDLYTLPVDDPDKLTLLLKRGDEQEAYFNPTWSPDGAYVYYAHSLAIGEGSAITFTYRLERMAVPGGEPETLIEDAFWPRLSADGSKLAYVTFDPRTFSNDLYVADADGANPVRLVEPNTFVAVDAPMFSPDGTHVLFSAVSLDPTPALTWLDQLLGVQVASAHSVPSDWWSVPVDSGQPKRLTEILDTGMYADAAPDGEHIAFVSATGLFVMNPDGENLQRLLDVWAGGTVDWAP